MDGSGVILRDEAVVDNSVARQGNDDPTCSWHPRIQARVARITAT